MANPKCGTCRFFQENDLPGSGWCHHPQRKVSSDVKILVRRSELACRDDWSRHLWQPATGDSAVDASAARPPAGGPLAPASPESLRAVLNRDLASAAPAGEDVLLSEGRIVSERAEPWQPTSRPFPGGNFDPRTAIFRAREAYREKIRANSIATREAAAEAGAGTFERAGARSEHTGHDQDVVRSDFSDSFETERHVMTRGEAPEPEPAPAEISDGIVEATGPGVDAMDLDPPLDGSDFWAFEGTSVIDGTVAEYKPPANVCAPDHSALRDDGEPLAAKQLMLAADLPAWFRANLPRVCRTCRDFRPGTDGQRGWCANAWAFTHRQLVQEDDPAPCHSAIGDWWAPIDDVWLVAADVSSHGRLTPLLDRMVGAETGQRRRS